jgi:ribulose-5-phosphate 4-epimerase/fuculose-1-phosphate aldolase
MNSTPSFGPPLAKETGEERHYRRQRLAAALRIFGRSGFESGVAGHMSVRDPEHQDRFWVNALAMPFGAIQASNLVCVDADGHVVAGDRAVNLAAFHIHSKLHQARPDVVSVAHTHSVYGKAWSTFGRLLDPITQDACTFFEDHSVCTHYGGPALGPTEADKIVEALGGKKAVILQNHGLLTVGGSVDEAAWWFLALENACQVQLLAEAAGTPISIDEETARLTAKQSGAADVGWLSFQPLYEELVAQEPEVLE